ncbi:MAG TPA: VOC family protein [Verrucomicrobiae bacterium]|jgi:predicted enzyme related to lactoylglutathione lyase
MSASREKVTGIGGVFIKAAQPDKLAEWYAKHLGIGFESNPGDSCHYYNFISRAWENPERKVQSVFAIFPVEAAGPTRNVTINFRVGNLSTLIEQLRAGGVAIDKTEDYDYGRFAWIKDPEGNPIELYQDTTS